MPLPPLPLFGSFASFLSRWSSSIHFCVKFPPLLTNVFVYIAFRALGNALAVVTGATLPEAARGEPEATPSRQRMPVKNGEYAPANFIRLQEVMHGELTRARVAMGGFRRLWENFWIENLDERAIRVSCRAWWVRVAM